jgi:large subunit ribosomal protein L13
MKTTVLKPQAPSWVIVDANGQSLGRIAADIAHVLRGKHNPSFSPHQVYGDHVIVINAEKLAIPQKKLMQKLYMRHSGYIGHLRSRTLKQMMEKSPEEVVKIAVKGMLPSNRLRPIMLKNLHIFVGDEHPHTAQQPTPLSLS